jgi:hypothetical protein
MNLDVVLGGLRKAGYHVSINHFRQTLTNSGYDCLQKHEMNNETQKVFNNGGFTRVTITTPGGDTLTGKHNFGASKPFCRRIGVIGALGRAFGSGKNLHTVISE